MRVLFVGLLMATTIQSDVLTAVMGQPLAIAYGRHVVAGNVIEKDESASDHSVVFVALGDGEWDAVESLTGNGVALTDRTGLGDAQGFLFHPGKPGQVGTGGETGDQKISRWFPAGVTQTTWSETAYVACWINRDIYAPGPDLHLQGVYRARKLQEYDGAGAPTVFQWSANPGWIVLDLLLKFHKVAAARIDYASFVTAAADCDFDIGGGVKRFEAHLFFREEDLGQALEAVLATCRGFLTEIGGKIAMRVDKVRASVHDFTMDNVVAGSARFEQQDTRKKPNHIAVKFRDTANNYAYVSHPVAREAHQDKVAAINRVELDIGNARHGQAYRIGDYFLARAIDLVWTGRLRGMQNSFHLLPGDVVRVKLDFAPFPYAAGTPDWKLFDVLESTDTPSGEREFALQEYADATYSDTEEASQALASAAVQSWYGAPANVTGHSAVENSALAADGRPLSRITCTFTAPNPRLNWAGVEIWLENTTRGDPARVAGAGGTSPIVFDLEPTGDTVKLYFVSVAVDGRARAVLTSPSVAGVILDGRDSAPPAPSNFTGQAPVDQAPNVTLSWDENSDLGWKDIAAYEIALRYDANAPGDADVFDRVAATFGATKKVQYVDAPGPNANQARYYVRAVLDTINPATSKPWASAWSGPATITTLAPDGTTDTGVPTVGVPTGSGAGTVVVPGTSADHRAQPGFIVIQRTNPSVLNAAENVLGTFQVEFEVKSWADEALTSDPRTTYHVFPFDPTPDIANIFKIPGSNRWMEYARARVINYFGKASAYNNLGSANLPFASEAQDVGDGNYNPNTSSGRIAGLNQVKAQSSNDLKLTVASGTKVWSDKLIESTLKLSAPTTEGDTITTRAGSGDLTLTTQGAGNKVSANRTLESTVKLSAPTTEGDTITTRAASGDLTITTQGSGNKVVMSRPLDCTASGVRVRYFDAADEPDIAANEIAIWFDNDGGAVYLLAEAGGVQRKVAIA